MANEEIKDVAAQNLLQRDFEKEIVEIVRSGYHAQKLKELLAEFHENDVAKALPLLNEFNLYLHFNANFAFVKSKFAEL